MKYVDEYRDREHVKIAADKIKEAVDGEREYVFMEVCGTHTMAIARFGLKALLPPNVRLISGPGCPVCVTPMAYIDKAIAYSKLEGILIATFGDMVRVPGSNSSLAEIKALRGNVKVVYSATDGLRLAVENHGKKIIFLGVGFETTAPTIAAVIKDAEKKGIDNFLVLSGHKIIPPALKALIVDKRLNLDGFILPAHVSTIIGTGPYRFIARDFGIPSVITGFEPLDILQGISMLIRQIADKNPDVEVQYSRVVRPQGNRLAQDMLQEVFKIVDSEWRGLGVIPKSGLAIRRGFARYDAEREIKVRQRSEGRGRENGCICGEILKGLKRPDGCRLFGKKCAPEHPVGPCMVSSEGTCSAWYLYNYT